MSSTVLLSSPCILFIFIDYYFIYICKRCFFNALIPTCPNKQIIKTFNVTIFLIIYSLLVFCVFIVRQAAENVIHTNVNFSFVCQAQKHVL